MGLMQGAVSTILDAVGQTPLVRLNRLAEDVSADVYVKCEYLNPAGSMKDRMALAVLEAAEARGQLRPGSTVVEATSGNAGAALAMVAAVRGYKCIFVVPDNASSEKLGSLRAWGARVVVCPSAVDAADPRSHTSVARRIAAELPGGFYANQYENADNPKGHYASTGAELWAQAGEQIDVLVAGIGTGGSIQGAGRYLKERKPSLRLVGVDPVGALYRDSVKSGGAPRAPHGDAPHLGEPTAGSGLVDEVVRIDEAPCFLTARDLVRQEGLFVGGSSGAAVAGALSYARRTQREERIVVLLPDSAARYLTTIFNDDWMRENGFLGDSALGSVRDLLRHKSHEIITASPYDRVRDVVTRMKAHGISQLPVVDGTRLLGAVTEVDLLRHLVNGEQSLDSAVGPLAENDFATVSPHTSIESLQGRLNDARMAIVTEGDAIVGVVTKIDLIDHLARRAT